MTKVNVGLIQTKAFEDKERNLEKHLELIRKAAKDGAEVICLQELFLTKYFCQTEDSKFFKHSDTIPGNLTKILSELSKELKIVLVASLFEKRTQGLYHNTAVIFDADGSIVGKYRKMHIPDDPGFYEKYYFTPGDLGFRAFNTKFGKIGLLICWDQWFVEAARLVALDGAQIIFYPTAIGWGDDEENNAKRQQIEAWHTMHRSHSISNGVFVAAANRIGKEDKITFWGESTIFDPHGELLVKGSQNNEEILITQCDFKKIDSMREGWPFFRDRRIDAYQNLLNRYIDINE